MHCNIPWVVLLDPTSACNLKCKGCWAAEYGYKSNLSLDEMRKIIFECKELGTHFFMFTGGEPLIRKKDLITLALENQDCIFLAFTNGTLVDEEFCLDLKKCKNFGLALSIEGTEETNDERRGDGVYNKTLDAMAVLKKHGCIFGTSICYTSKNYEAVTSDEFYDKMIECGAKYMWYFHYMPVGGDADTELLLTPEQREHVYRSVREKEIIKPASLYLQLIFRMMPNLSAAVSQAEETIFILIPRVMQSRVFLFIILIPIFVKNQFLSV